MLHRRTRPLLLRLRQKVDLVVTSYDLHPPHTAFDATVSVPLLPSHLASAAKDASILFSD